MISREEFEKIIECDDAEIDKHIKLYEIKKTNKESRGKSFGFTNNINRKET